MNFTSSIAKTLVGSVIAIVSVAPARLQRHDLILARRLGGHQLDDRGIDLELIQRDRGHAVLLRQQRGDLLVLDVAELHEIGAELAAIRALVVQGLLELFRRNALLFEKQFPDSNRHSSDPPSKTSSARRRSTSVHRRGRARRALPPTFPASTLRRCPRRPPRVHRRSCFAERRRARRAVGSSTTSRRPPRRHVDRRRRRARHHVAIDRDDHPRDAGPTRSPRAANPHFAIQARTAAAVVAKRRRRQVAPDDSDADVIHRTPSRPASTSPRSSTPAPHTNFGVTPTTMYLADRLHQRHADRRRREGVHTAPHFFSAVGRPSLQAQQPA